MNAAVNQLAGGGAHDERAAPAALISSDAESARYSPGARGAACGSGGLGRALVVLPLGSAVFAVSALWSPSQLPGVVLCPFRALTGLPCPGCGMTRAFCSISHGEFARAFGYNALAPFVFAGALLLWAHALATVLKLEGVRLALEGLRPTPRVARLMLALVLAWWAVRLCAGL
jgi:hypothetical protein